MKFIYVVMFFLSFFFVQITSAEPYPVGAQIPPFTLNDQHGNSAAVDESIRLIIFCKDKAGNKLVSSALENTEKDYLPNHHAVYVSDISGMPGLISKLFALPKMRKYHYRVLLDKDQSVSKNFPFEPERVTLIHLTNLNIKAVHFVNTPEAIKNTIESVNLEKN